MEDIIDREQSADCEHSSRDVLLGCIMNTGTSGGVAKRMEAELYTDRLEIDDQQYGIPYIDFKIGQNSAVGTYNLKDEIDRLCLQIASILENNVDTIIPKSVKIKQQKVSSDNNNCITLTINYSFITTDNDIKVVELNFSYGNNN